jgi:hypothetical protein
MSGPADDFEVTCEWNMANESEALSRFNFLRATLDSCLAAEFEQHDNVYSQDGYSVLRRYAGSVVEDDEDYRSVDITLEQIQYIPEDGSPMHSVQLAFDR